MCLNCMGPLIFGFFFSVINTTILHDLQLTEFADTEPRMQRKLGYKETAYMEGQLEVLLGFLTSWWVGDPIPCVTQKPAVLLCV